MKTVLSVQWVSFYILSALPRFNDHLALPRLSIRAEVGCIANVSKVFSVSIFKTKWLLNGRCRYL
jgi:hypothetical protein